MRLGVDVGSVRVGVARSDPDGLLATPLETVRRGRRDLDRLARIADEVGAVEVVVGLPTSLSGGEGPSAREARRFADALARRVAPLRVRLVDERLSTVTAERELRGRRRGKAKREVVDQAAATVILQGALDAERGTGNAPGQLLGSLHG